MRGIGLVQVMWMTEIEIEEGIIETVGWMSIGIGIGSANGSETGNGRGREIEKGIGTMLLKLYRRLLAHLHRLRLRRQVEGES
jgi:hypothetical protein